MSTKPTNSNELRNVFLNYFKSQDHLILPSSSLIPANDPTLLLTNSGMAQFKSYFSGQLIPPHPRITTSQKCFRTTDIEEVGDDTHLTLFEMLGNFSFGNYFKKEACEMALDLMLNHLDFDIERLYFTVYESDDEAESIWLDLGIPIEKIYRFGDKDNWWGPAGEEGPCGPSSEINYFTGSLDKIPNIIKRDHTSEWGPNNSKEFIELYNLVFTQFNRDLKKIDTPLPSKNIDTGMGLERTLVILQNVKNIYETDLFTPIIKHIEKVSKLSSENNQSVTQAIRVVAEHTRSASFLINDGVIPENSGRGYVLRRLIRRGMLFGDEIGIKKYPLSSFVPTVIEVMKSAYPELKDNESFIIEILEKEESTFTKTLNFGSSVLQGMLNFRKINLNNNYKKDQISKDDAFILGEKIAESVLPESTNNINIWSKKLTGKETFLLYDTYGFPPEITIESIKKIGMSLDLDSFNIEMEKQKQRSRNSHKTNSGISGLEELYKHLNNIDTPFKGYENTEITTKIKAIYLDGKIVESSKITEDVIIILDETPFYAERGGQIGDTGKLYGDDFIVDINDTIAPLGHINIHNGKITKGIIRVGDKVKAEVDNNRRQKIMRNHTATHLLHAALREIIGPHVKQSGSLVEPDRLRFDFTNINALSNQDIQRVESKVSEKIRNNIPVEVHWTSYNKAVSEGALAFFADTYENDVRTIKIDAPWSYELCGGTHMESTGGIGSFIITSEIGIGTGIRRIEAVTGIKAEEITRKYLNIVKDLSDQFKTPPENIYSKILDFHKQNQKDKKEIEKLHKDLLEAQFNQNEKNINTEIINIGNKHIEIQTVREKKSSLENLRNIADKIKSNKKDIVVVIGGEVNSKPSIIVMADKSSIDQGVNSGVIANYLANLMDGGGGGSAHNAQAGGKNIKQLDIALGNVSDAVKFSINEHK